MDYLVWEMFEFILKICFKEVIMGCVGYFIKVIVKVF